MNVNAPGNTPRAHPDYTNNVYKAEFFINDQKSKLANGINAMIRDGEHIKNAVLCLSFSSQNGNFARNISLHQPTIAMIDEMYDTWKTINEIAQNILEK